MTSLLTRYGMYVREAIVAVALSGKDSGRRPDEVPSGVAVIRTVVTMVL